MRYSAPHDACRLFSRTEAKDRFTVDEFQNSMQGICSTCTSHRTIGESPMAYKSMDDIVNNISPTADIIRIIKPVTISRQNNIDFYLYQSYDIFAPVLCRMNEIGNDSLNSCVGTRLKGK